jgi:hypothetical protein
MPRRWEKRTDSQLQHYFDLELVFKGLTNVRI